MATFLDVGLLEHFGSVFVVLLVFLIVFGILEAFKVFGGAEKRTLHAVIAFAISLLVLISKSATLAITSMVPWFTVFVIFIFFTLFLFRMFGVDDAQFLKVIKDSGTYPVLIVFAVIILIYTLGTVFGQSMLETGEGVSPGDTNQYQGGVSLNQTGAGGNIEGVRQLPVDYQSGGSVATTDYSTNVIQTIRHPKVLGLIFVMFIGIFSFWFLTKPVFVED